MELQLKAITHGELVDQAILLRGYNTIKLQKSSNQNNFAFGKGESHGS